VRKSIALSLIAVLAAACATAPPAPPAPTHEAALAVRLTEPLPFDPEVRRGTLQNGLTYYVRANAKPEQRAELRLVVNAGSVLESEEQRGLAHFLEHMAFNGTARFEKQELVNYLERIGMRFGPDINAYTSFDETVYMLQVPTDDPQIVATAFDILLDWAQAIALDEEEIEKERGVVIEEWRLGRSAAGRISDKEVPVLFHGSQYAERLPIGTKEVLDNAPPERIRAFYRDWYRPDLMAVVAVGDFDATAIETTIRERFSAIPRREDAPERIEFQIPDHERTLVSSVTDPEATWINVQVTFKRPRVEMETVGDMRRQIIDGIYHSMMNARLQELGRAADPPYQMAFAGSGPLLRAKSAYHLFARASDGGVERALTTLLTEAKRVEEHGFHESELARAKTDVLRQVDRTWDERDKQESARFASQYVYHFLNDYPALSIGDLRDLNHALVPGVTLGEVNARANQWITDVNRVILTSGPEKKESAIPGEERLLAVFQATETLGVTPWVDRVRDEPLVAHAPAPGRVIEETTIDTLGVTSWTLSNGAVVLLKPTDFKNDEVLIWGWSPGGSGLAPDTLHLSASNADSIVSEMGLGSFDPNELGKALTGKIARISANIGESSEYLRGTASPRDLETAMQLLYLRFTGARRDEEAFASHMAKLRGRLQNQEASPDYAFAKKMNEVLTQNHPRRRFLTVERLDEIRLDDALAFYEDRFADASDFIFTIVGTFQLETIRPLVETWIGGLPAVRRGETWRNVGVDEPDGVHRVLVEKGIDPRASVRITFHGDAPWSLDEHYRISSLQEVMRIRLREELREDRGGVYGVGVAGGLVSFPDQEYKVTISFSADPERVDELVDAVFDEIAKLQTSGPDEDYVQRVREIQRRKHETDLKLNTYWISWMEFLARNDVPLEEILRHRERYESATPESIRDSARRYLDSSRYVLGVLKPEASTPAATDAVEKEGANSF
jgi:zinc protease